MTCRFRFALSGHRSLLFISLLQLAACTLLNPVICFEMIRNMANELRHSLDSPLPMGIWQQEFSTANLITSDLSFVEDFSLGSKRFTDYLRDVKRCDNLLEARKRRAQVLAEIKRKQAEIGVYIGFDFLRSESLIITPVSLRRSFCPSIE
jgi:hypothetical protein